MKKGRNAMIDSILQQIAEYDPEVGGAMKEEMARQRGNIELIASENIVTEQVIREYGGNAFFGL